VRCNGSYGTSLQAASFAVGWRLTFRARNARGQVAVVRRRLVMHAPPFAVSPNWSGYILRPGTAVTEASGQFTVPTLNCADTSDAAMSTWVGIGGAGSGTGDLLQTGVRSNCVGGVQLEDAGWWELIPPLPEEDFNSMSVSAGDSMRATVWQNADGSWSTRLDDLTTGISGLMTTGNGYGTILDANPTVWLDEEGSTVGLAYSGADSAEWIAEDFEDASTQTLVPLADFSSVTFTGLTTSLPSWGLTSDEQVGIGDANGYLWAAPTAADSSGKGFSVNYTG
jgi:hypothetical protein